MNKVIKKSLVVILLTSLPLFMSAQQIENRHWCISQIKDGDKINNTPDHTELFLDGKINKCSWQGKTRTYKLTPVGMDKEAYQLVLFNDDNVTVFCTMTVKVEEDKSKSTNLKLILKRAIDGDLQYSWKVCPIVKP